MDEIRTYTCTVTRFRWGQWYTWDNPTWPMRMRLGMQVQNLKGALTWFLGDVLLGRERFSRSETITHDATLTLPEGDYPLRVTLSVITGRRPRWPWLTTRGNSACINVLTEGGVPTPEGALSRIVCDTETAEEAVMVLRRSIAFRRGDVQELNRLLEG
jgi:hypothetical protein